jgi:hypothetical protein
LIRHDFSILSDIAFSRMGDEMNLSAVRRTYLEVAEDLTAVSATGWTRINHGGDANLNSRRAYAKAIHYRRGSSSYSSFEFDRLLGQ